MITNKLILLVFAIFGLVSGFKAVPGLISSHKLIPGLQGHVSSPKSKPYPLEDMMGLSKRLISACSSDIYMLINHPNLKLEDFENYETWPFLRRYLSLSSTIVTFPFAEGALDLDHLEKYIIKTCQAETIRVDHEDESEVPHYIDTRKRIIKLNFNAIDENLSDAEKSDILKDHDELIRKILRKLPSPHYSIILTSDNVKNYHPIPENILEAFPKKGEIFPDIALDESRLLDFERNENVKNVPPMWSKPIHNKYGYKPKNHEIKLLDRKLLIDNEKLIIAIVVMIISFFLHKIFSFVKGIFGTANKSKQN